MQILEQIPTNYFLALDIETVREYENYSDLPADGKTAWSYKMKHEGVICDEETLAHEYHKRAALYAEFSRVCAISIVFMNTKGEVYCKEFKVDGNVTELDMLNKFGSYINKIKLHDSNYRFVAHAGKWFDYPFLKKRFAINRLKLPVILDDAHLKPWEQTNLCTNKDLWKMGGDGPGSSLVGLCYALGIPLSKNDIQGDEVGDAYFRGEYDRISRYCSQDTLAVFNIIRVLKNEPIIMFDDIKIS
jgi:3'-5' exonuclease